MLRAYFGTLAALVTWRVAARYGLPWGVVTAICEVSGLGLVALAVKASRAAWRGVAAKGGRA